MAAHDRQPLVELAAELEHGAGVVGERVLLPGVAARSAASLISVVGVAMMTFRAIAYSSSPGSCSQRGAEERLAGHEQDDELRRRAESRFQ